MVTKDGSAEAHALLVYKATIHVLLTDQRSSL